MSQEFKIEKKFLKKRFVMTWKMRYQKCSTIWFLWSPRRFNVGGGGVQGYFFKIKEVFFHEPGTIFSSSTKVVEKEKQCTNEVELYGWIYNKPCLQVPILILIELTDSFLCNLYSLPCFLLQAAPLYKAAFLYESHFT